MVKKRSSRSKGRLTQISESQHKNTLRFNAILMSAIAVFVILFIYFLFLQPYFDSKSIKFTTHSITGKFIQQSDIALNLTFDESTANGMPAGKGVVSGATLVNNGKSGKAYSFDGINDYINLTGYSMPTNEITISAWIYPKYHYGRSTMLFSGYNYANKQGINFAVNNQKLLSFIIGNGTSLSSIISNTSLSLNTWHHVVAVKNNTHTYIFVDNVKQTQTIQLTGPINYSSAITRIGNPNNSTFNGTIDEFKIFNRTLTDAEVVAEYNSYAPPITPPDFSCEDSDINAFGGQNTLTKYYVKGFINTSIDGVNYTISEDSCTADNASVIEYFCNNSQLGQSRNYTCPTSCKNGACIGNSTCIDSDAMNYSTQGSITYSIDSNDLIYYDYCSPENEKTLVEFFCSGNNWNYSFHSCSANYSCFLGRCNNTAVNGSTIVNNSIPTPVCTDGEHNCSGTSYVLCENGQWLDGVLISGQCNYDDGTGADEEIIDNEPVTGEANQQKKPSGIWIVILIFLIIAVMAAIAIIFFIFLKKRNEFNNKTQTLVRPSSPPPSLPQIYSKTPSIQSPIPSSILPAPSTPQQQSSQTTATTSISSASNLKKRQM